MNSYKTIATAFASQLSNESALTESILSLELLAKVLKHKRLGQLLQNDLIDLSVRKEVLAKVLAFFPSKEFASLVVWLTENKQIPLLSKIIDTLKEIRKKQYNTVEGELTTVKALSPHDIQRIKEMFEQALQSKVLLKTSQNDTILGGLVFRSGDMLFDASISKQLQNLEKMILTHTL